MYPQLAKAISVARKTPIDQTENLADAMLRCGEIINSEGRLLIRYSGTEKKIRLLAEGKDLKKIQRCMELLEKAVELDLQ